MSPRDNVCSITCGGIIYDKWLIGFYKLKIQWMFLSDQNNGGCIFQLALKNLFSVLQVQTRMFSQTPALFNKRINKKGELFEILQLLDYVFLNGFK